jgi:uncharacterized SAM-dependent methyltransferase
LKRIRRVCRSSGALLLGVDLKKDPGVLHAAYNDSAGVTAEFNINVLRRINEVLGADFDLDRWRHRAVYNQKKGRIEMHLVSLGAQRVSVGTETIAFEPGETIWTESSYKYALDEFGDLANRAGFDVDTVWTDPQNLFSVQYLTVSSTQPIT